MPVDVRQVTLGECSRILCCNCGTVIQSNESNMCMTCLTEKVDITKHIDRQNSITFCPKCERYLNPPNQWVSAALESPQLLSMCVKRVRGLNKGLSIQGAKFIWTEPHSRRINIEVAVRGELPTGDLIEQEIPIEFVVHTQQCPECTRTAAKDFWNACVQVRQRVKHKKTLLCLEQIILRAGAHIECNNIKRVTDGMDFYFTSRTHAMSFVNFLCKRAPCRYQTSQHLKSHDANNNTYNYKYTFSVEVAPVCKNDVVCLSKAQSQKLGGIGRLCIVSKVSEAIHLVDPATCQVSRIEATAYFASPFTTIASQSQLSSFMVVEVEQEAGYTGDGQEDCRPSGKTGDRLKRTSMSTSSRGLPRKHRLTSLWLMPLDSHGGHASVNGEEQGNLIHTRSHLGFVIHEGDTVLGLDLRNCNINNSEFEDLQQSRDGYKLPDVLCVLRPNQLRHGDGDNDDDDTGTIVSLAGKPKRPRSRPVGCQLEANSDNVEMVEEVGDHEDSLLYDADSENADFMSDSDAI